MKDKFSNQIEVSKELDKVTESGIQVEVLKKRRKRNKIISLSISAFILSNLIFFNTTSFASVKDFFIGIASYFGVSNDLDEYKATIGSSVSDNGYTVTVNEALVNGNELIVSTTIKSDSGPISSDIELHPSILINGEEIRYDSDEMYEYEDNTTINSVGTYRFKEELVGDLEVELQYKPFLIKGDSEVDKAKGSWNFAFNVDADALESSSVIVELDEVITLNSEIEVELKEYKSNSFSTTIETSVGGDVSSYEVKLIGVDNLGNKIEFIINKLSLDENNMGYLSFGLDTENSELSSDATELRLYTYLRDLGSLEEFTKIDSEIVVNLK